MAEIYKTNDDGSVIEMSNWGLAGEQGSQIMTGRTLEGKDLELFKELKESNRSDSSIWLEMHPAWPRGNGREILRPLKRPDVQAKKPVEKKVREAPKEQEAVQNDVDNVDDLEDGKVKFPLRQLATAMLIKIISTKCETKLESLNKMTRKDMETLAQTLLGRDYILLNLDDC